MMIVAGDYIVNTFEGTEQYAKPYRLVTHPLYNRSTNNADIMLIKVKLKPCRDAAKHCYQSLTQLGFIEDLNHFKEKDFKFFYIKINISQENIKTNTFYCK